MIDQAYEEVERRKSLSERGSFKMKMMKGQSPMDILKDKRGSKIDIKQKKEVLKEVLTVMKFAVF